LEKIKFEIVQKVQQKTMVLRAYFDAVPFVVMALAITWVVRTVLPYRLYAEFVGLTLPFVLCAIVDSLFAGIQTNGYARIPSVESFAGSPLSSSGSSPLSSPVSPALSYQSDEEYVNVEIGGISELNNLNPIS
jgi:hypothetical protein